MRSAVCLAVLYAAAQVRGWGRSAGEVSGLSLRGNGCHVEIASADGGVICSGIATPVPTCSPLLLFRNDSDGGTAAEKVFLGSSCPPPRIESYSSGNGFFFLERGGTVFSVICDDAPSCQRNSHSAEILKCCREDRSMQKLHLCNVKNQLGICVESK
jgi:hypothetical protein